MFKYKFWHGKMEGNSYDYNIFLQFLETYKGKGFQDIKPDDPLNASLENKMRSTGQFFHIADLVDKKASCL